MLVFRPACNTLWFCKQFTGDYTWCLLDWWDGAWAKSSNADQSYGALGLNRSVEGKPLTAGGKTYIQGLGSHANSKLVYDLSGQYERFEAWVGGKLAAGH